MNLENRDEALKKLLKHLCKNRLGDTFCRKVATSLDRPKPVKMHKKYDRLLTQLSYQKKQKKQRVSTSPSRQLVPLSRLQSDFKIKSGPYGQSIMIHDHVPSPRKLKSKISYQQRGRGTTLFDKSSGILNDFMSKRSEYAKNNTLGAILSKLTRNPHYASIRIYKQKLKNYYNQRYGKQKLTSFLDYQFIEDYNSQMQLLQTLLSFNLQEILLLSFLTLDHDGDGLLSNDDLFNLATATNKQNFLVNKDIYSIFHYISSYRKSKHTVNDTLQQEFTRDPTLTLQKYRLMILKKEKQKQKSKVIEQRRQRSLSKGMIDVPKGNKVLVKSRKINKQLFSFHQEEDQGDAIIKSLKKKFAHIIQQNSTHTQFKINFERFKTIFHNSIPQTYFDILYTQGGVTIPGKVYAPLKLVYVQIEQIKTQKVQIDRYAYFRKRLQDMKTDSRVSGIENFNKTHGRLLSV